MEGGGPVSTAPNTEYRSGAGEHTVVIAGNTTAPARGALGTSTW